MIAGAVGLAALIVSGVCLRRSNAEPDLSRATTAVRAALRAFALLVVVEALLGAWGLLTARNVAVVLGALAGTLLLWKPGQQRPGAPRAALSRLESSLFAIVCAALLLLLWTGLHRTNFPYDSLSYHLHTPVTWMNAQRIEIVPAVFGDPAPAYAPSNLELWFLFLLAPLRSDYLAGAGQIPFAALAAAAIVASVREAGGQRVAALGAAAAFLLIPEVQEQAPSAMVDVGMAALLLASLPFARRAEGLTCAVALGLALGTKYVALVLALPFAVFAAGVALRRPRSVTLGRLVAGTVIVFATGGFWYVRNTVVTGNPIFPGAVPLPALPALYGGAAMRGWDYHVPIGHLVGLASMLAGTGGGFAVAAAVAFARRRWTSELLLAGALVALFWVVIPYQESRFLFAAFGLAAISIGRAAERPPAWLGWGGLAAAIVGSLVTISMRDRLVLISAAALGAYVPIAIRRIPAAGRAALVLGGSLCLITTVVIGFRDYAAREPGYGVRAWSWFRTNVRNARVAYTGTNLEFPLTGERLSNHVMYVNIAGEPGDRLHDFARRTHAQPGLNPEPALYREGGSFAVWWQNLRASRVDVLFVARLHAIVRRNVAADRDGFPIERSWADAHPDRFILSYASPDARVYLVEGAGPQGTPASENLAGAGI